MTDSGDLGTGLEPEHASEQPSTSDLLGTDSVLPLDPLAPSDHLRRRQLVSRLVSGSQTAAALLAVAVLGTVVYSVASHATSVLSLGFLTKDLPRPGLITPGGGIAPAIVGTAVLIAIATAIALPVGILIALYQSEFAGPRSKPGIKLALDLLNGLPTIIVGLFVFGLLVVGHHQSGFAGAFALSIVILPLIARASQEVLALVPPALREAAEALGLHEPPVESVVTRWPDAFPQYDVGHLAQTRRQLLVAASLTQQPQILLAHCPIPSATVAQ